jgi:hypothetical protein
VAEAHIEAGWAPKDTRVDEFEAAIRAVCEPIFDRPLKDISFGKVLLRLFQTSRRFNVEIQPQLVMLQKTLLNIEGLGRQLDPELDLWKTAKPFLERWMSEQVGWRGCCAPSSRKRPIWRAPCRNCRAWFINRWPAAQRQQNRWLAIIALLLALLTATLLLNLAMAVETFNDLVKRMCSVGSTSAKLAKANPYVDLVQDIEIEPMVIRSIVPGTAKALCSDCAPDRGTWWRDHDQRLHLPGGQALQTCRRDAARSIESATRSRIVSVPAFCPGSRTLRRVSIAVAKKKARPARPPAVVLHPQVDHRSASFRRRDPQGQIAGECRGVVEGRPRAGCAATVRQ